MPADLPPSLIAFIQRCVPTLQAAEVLLFFAAHPDRDFAAEELVVAIRPIVVTVPAVREYATVFAASGLLIEKSGRLSYGPVTRDAEEAIAQLGRAYNERPVTLITAIYAVADTRLRSFADSFKLRGDKS